MANNISTGAILAEAWSLVKGSKLAFFKIIVLSFIAAGFLILAGLYLMLNFAVLGFGISTVIAVVISISCLFTYFKLVCTLRMTGIKRSLGMSLVISKTWLEVKKVQMSLLIIGVLYYLIQNLLSFSGKYILNNTVPVIVLLAVFLFVFLVIQSIFMVFAVPLIIMKNENPMAALQVGWGKTIENFFSIIKLEFVLVSLNMIALILFGIGLLWAMPLFYIANGILFRNIFGVKAKNTSPAPTLNDANMMNLTFIIILIISLACGLSLLTLWMQKTKTTSTSLSALGITKITASQFKLPMTRTDDCFATATLANIKPYVYVNICNFSNAASALAALNASSSIFTQSIDCQSSSECTAILSDEKRKWPIVSILVVFPSKS